MKLIDMLTRKVIAPVSLAPVNMGHPISEDRIFEGVFDETQLFRKPFNPVISTSVEQANRGILMTFATDFIEVLKEAGCDPSEAFAVASLMEKLVRDESRIVDVSPDEADLVWKD